VLATSERVRAYVHSTYGARETLDLTFAFQPVYLKPT
jgi:hypothetical protein